MVNPRFQSVCQILVAIVMLLSVPCAASAPSDAYRVSVRDDGVYRLPFEALEPEVRFSVASDWISLWDGDEPLALWVDDGGDGYFGPGDALEFVGEHRAGEHTYYHPASRENVYWLRLDRPDGLRMIPWTVPRSPTGELVTRFQHHEERDETKVRFAGRRDGIVPDEWYWAKMTPIDKTPVQLPLDLSRWHRDAGPLEISLAFQGWSKPRRRVENDPRDHRVEVWLDGVRRGVAEWDGHDAFILELDPIAASTVSEARPQIELRVPRRLDAAGEPWVDVVLFDWLEIEFPMHAVASESYPLHFAAGAAGAFSIEGGGESELVVYGSEGHRTVTSSARYVPGSVDETWAYAVVPGRQLPPSLVEAESPSDLRLRTAQVDYLMIAHRRLMESIEPLAEFHRRRGLTVEVVDVQDIYDEFNHGLVAPEALKDFIADAYTRREKPTTRFVLLVGDASWDPRGGQSAEDRDYADWTFRGNEARPFVKNSSTAYADADLDRNLVPARPYQSYEGHAAADNWFVSVDGEDFHPDLAIGRLPVTQPEEVEAIVAKTIRYVEESDVGPWRRQVLWITNEQAGMQRSSDRLASELGGRGYAERKVYPLPEEKDNVEHQAVLKEAFSDGNLFVHFLGHGGRYIWRTGPPNFSKDHDLFTLDHLDELAPTNNLPIILSMTCYSAPFDHPTADSIGEKFLRLADRGAVAVLAASWRNSPGRQFSQALLDELTTPGTTVGGAIQRAKGQVKSRVLVETYNLLGDPALPVPLPLEPISARLVEEQGTTLVEIDPGSIRGQALIEWLGVDGSVLYSLEEPVSAVPLRVETPSAVLLAEGEPVRVRVYAWDRSARRDGITVLDLDTAEDADPVEELEAEKPSASSRVAPSR